MTMKFYKITLRQNGVDRTVRVQSPTGVQAVDAASPLMRDGEEVIGIENVDDDGALHADMPPPPRTQAEELAPATPGMAATDVRSASPTVHESKIIDVRGPGGAEYELLDTGQEEVFSRTEVETGRIEHNTTTGGLG